LDYLACHLGEQNQAFHTALFPPASTAYVQKEVSFLDTLLKIRDWTLRCYWNLFLPVLVACHV